MSAALESFGLEVSQATSGHEAIFEIEASAKEKPYQMVLMDWKMPGMDGIEAAKRIKSNSGLSAIPAIFDGHGLRPGGNPGAGQKGGH